MIDNKAYNSTSSDHQWKYSIIIIMCVSSLTHTTISQYYYYSYRPFPWLFSLFICNIVSIVFASFSLFEVDPFVQFQLFSFPFIIVIDCNGPQKRRIFTLIFFVFFPPYSSVAHSTPWLTIFSTPHVCFSFSLFSVWLGSTRCGFESASGTCFS